MTINLNYLKTRVVRYPLLVLTGASALLVTGLNSKLSTSDFSSWVQALGSIAALGIAIFIMSRQNQHAVRIVINTDRRALLRRGEAVLVLMFNAHQSVDISCNDLIGSLVTGVPSEEILENMKAIAKATQEARAILAAVPLHELGSREMVSGAIMMLETMTFICASIELWQASPPQEFHRPHGNEIALHYKNQAEMAMKSYQFGLDALEAADF